SNSTYDKEKLEQAKEAATDWTRANAEKIKETAKKEAGYKVKSTDITAGENAILVVEPMDSRRYDSKHSDPKDPCHGSNACTVGNKIELPMRTVNAKDDDALADILAHEGIHVTLNHTNDKRDRRDDDREIGDRQHKVTCALGKGCDETRYCGPEKDCNECGPGTAQRRALWACLGFDQTTRGPGDADRTTTVINPGPDAVSDTGDSVLGACFGNSSGGAGFPMECAALDCLDGQVPTLVTQQGVQVCKCSTESVRAGRGGVDTCAQIQCGPNERPVMTPNGCGCAPSDGEGTRPVRPSPTPRPGGF
ncbi:MAG: hypothetical protein HY698_15865, partial [Deltaproteobacteria bacterium]|nr:hypothetical protein [Deltaproteobacteria bacterium]